MPKFAKPIEEILEAQNSVKGAMVNYLFYRDLRMELKTDIEKRFEYPSLWAALDKLIELKEKEVCAETKMRMAGFTSEDAFALKFYEEEQEKEESIA